MIITGKQYILFLLLVYADCALYGETPVQPMDEEARNKAMWQGWSLLTEGGFHFKTLPDADFSNVTPSMGHDRMFWGEFGPLSSFGFKYSRTFKTHGYWGIKTMWSFFYPDVRLKGDTAKVTLSTIPVVGKYIGLGTAPGYVTMLIPLLYFDLGYITKKGYVFSIGSLYLWGLSPAFAAPLNDHLSLEFRTTIFLDRLFADLGYHNLTTAIGLNYKF